MAKRYSGRAVVTVLYEDRGDYKATVAIGKRNVWSGRIGAPRAGFGPGIGYDSPKAYDSTARAALSFADDETDGEMGGAAALETNGTDGWHVGRSVAARYPKQKNPSRKRKPAAKGALYNVRLFDPEVGSFRHYARMRGTSVRDVSRRFLAKWATADDAEWGEMGITVDDISVVKVAAKKAR